MRPATAALGSGDPTADTFLRGDEVWAPAIPAGVICMWAGSLSEIPTGWSLCDGSQNTPDLRSRFIKGAAPGAQPGATGGALTHQHAYTDVVAHTHAVNVTDPGHTHGQRVRNTGTAGTAGAQGSNTASDTTAGSTVSGTTGISATTAAPAGSVATGTTSAVGSEPPYFALAFICKL